jgi:hypothetical protein
MAMKAENLFWTEATGWNVPRRALPDAQLALLFASRAQLESATCVNALKARFPKAQIVGCSTSGQMRDSEVSDETATAMLLEFARTTILVAAEPAAAKNQSFNVGAALACKLAKPGLRSILVVSDGLHVNGSAVIAGLRSVVGDGVILTGGLAGDGVNFTKTLVLASGVAKDQIAAIGFYGEALIVGHGCAGGWDEFGPKRKITKSAGNVLSELDGTPALQLYKSYLGDEAEGLPGAALLYPLLLTDPENSAHTVVRTILAVDEANSAMTFAGDMPEGWSAQLMRGNFDRLAEGAAEAASTAMKVQPRSQSDVAAILISCVGRRILMGENIIDEVLATQSALGPDVHSIGFYSYGEIAPHAVSGFCELHNQTMTVTTLAEAL